MRKVFKKKKDYHTIFYLSSNHFHENYMEKLPYGKTFWQLLLIGIVIMLFSK